MSDNESDYYSDSVESDEESVKVSNKKPVVINAAKKFGNYIEDESEVDDSEPDLEEEEEEEIDEQVGGVEDDPDLEVDDEEDEAEPEEQDDDDEIEINEEGVALEKQPKSVKPKKTTQLIITDEDEDEDEYEENYLQKFDSEINKNYIQEFHPECLNHNSDEVAKLSRVIRDENNIIIQDGDNIIQYDEENDYE